MNPIFICRVGITGNSARAVESNNFDACLTMPFACSPKTSYPCFLWKVSFGMKTIYTINATSTGGRNGHVTTDYGLIDADVRLPKSLGGKDDEHLTPEAFFAAGYAACFDNAVMHVMRLEKVTSVKPIVTARINLVALENSLFGLSVELFVEIPGIQYEAALKFAEMAHRICPYSNAIKGNVTVTLNVKEN